MLEYFYSITAYMEIQMNMFPQQLGRNEQPCGHRFPIVPFTFFLVDKSDLCLRGKGQEEKVTIQSLKILSALWETQAPSTVRTQVTMFKFMSLVYNMISYHPEFQT